MTIPTSATVAGPAVRKQRIAVGAGSVEVLGQLITPTVSVADVGGPQENKVLLSAARSFPEA